MALVVPAVSDCPDDAAPDAVVEPATVIAPPATFAVGVRVTDVTAFTTVAL